MWNSTNSHPAHQRGSCRKAPALSLTLPKEAERSFSYRKILLKSSHRNSAHFTAQRHFPTNKTSTFGTLAQRQEFQEEISECPNHTLQCPVPRSPRERMDKEFSHLQSQHLICHFSSDSPAENKLGRQNQKGHKTNSWE